VRADHCHYPDFAVTTYGSGSQGEKDVIRLVIEVGSLGRDLRVPSTNDKQLIVAQILRYLSVMGLQGVRWAHKAVGMCILGTEVAIIQSSGNGKFPTNSPKWVSLYSREFEEVITSVAAIPT
jgi:hypothetical protein